MIDITLSILIYYIIYYRLNTQEADIIRIVVKTKNTHTVKANAYKNNIPYNIKHKKARVAILIYEK